MTDILDIEAGADFIYHVIKGKIGFAIYPSEVCKAYLYNRFNKEMFWKYTVSF